MESCRLGSIKVALPSSWGEVPFWKGQVIMEGGMNEIEIMALLSGIDHDIIKKSTDFESIYYLTHTMTFLSELPEGVKAPRMPRSFTIDENKRPFPYVINDDEFDLGKSSVGQIKDMEMIISNMSKTFIGEEERDLYEIETIKMCPFIVAIYIQKIIDREYDYDKATKLVDKVSLQMSFSDVVNIGYFFFWKLIALKRGYVNGHRKLNSPRRKLKRGLVISMKRLGLIQP